MSKEMELMLRIKAINDASKSLQDVQKELERLEKKKQALEKTLEKKIKLGVDTKETEENLKLVKDRLAAIQDIGEKKIAERALKEFGENAKKAKNETEEFFRKYQEGLFFLETSSRNVQQALGTVTNYLGGMGQSFIDAAAKSEMMGTAMTTVFAKDFKGNIEQAREAAKTFMEELKGFALKTPFETDEILQMGIKLKGYGLTVDEVKEKLRQLGDMAAAKNKSLSQAVEAFGDARMSELERLKEFDISRQMIDDAVNGRLSQAKNKAEEMKLIVEGLTSIIESNFKGGMERAAENYQTQVSNLRAAFNELKIELGNELLPVAKEVVGELTELTKWAKSFSPEMKTTATAAGAVVTGLALIGTAMAGIVAVGASVANSIIGVVSALGGLNVVLTAASGLWTGISLVFTGVVIPAFTAVGAALLSLPVAIGAVLIAGAKLFTWTQDYRMLIEDLKNQDANTVFSNQAKAMYELHQFYPQVTSAQSAFNIAQQQGLDNIAAQEDGLERLKVIVAALTAEEMKLQEERAKARGELSRLRQESEGLTPGDSSYFDYQEKIEAQEAIVEALGLTIGKLRDEKAAANDAANAYQNKSDAAGAKTPGGRLTDAEVNEEVRRQNLLTETQGQNLEQQILNLENFKSSYELTEMQRLQIDKEIGDARKKITAADDKSTKENLKKQKDAWDIYFKDLKVALKAGEISQGEYNSAIAEYLTENASTLEGNKDLKLTIEQAYYDGVNKLSTRGKKDREKDAKEELQRIKEQAEMRRNLLTSLAELTPDKFDDIEAWKEAQKIALEQQKEEYERHNVDKNEIDKWYYTALETLNKESQQKKKDLETEELQRQIGNKEKLLELSRRESETPGASSIFGDLQKQKQYLEEMYSLQEKMVSAIAQEGEPLLRRVEAGQKLNDTEQKTYDLYIDQLGKLDEIGDKILENANQEMLAYNRRKSAMLSYIQTAMTTGKITASEGSRMLQDFVNNATGQMRAHVDSIMETIDGDISRLTEADLQMFDVFNTALDDTIKVTGRLPQEFQNTHQSIKTGNQYIDEMAEKINNTASSVNKITSSMDNVTSATGKATSAAQGLTNGLSQAADKASQLADKMQTIGNLSASEGGSTPSGLGGFSSSPGGLGQWDNPSPSEMAGEAQAAKDKMYGAGNNTATSGGLTTGDQKQLGNIRGYTSGESGTQYGSKAQFDPVKAGNQMQDYYKQYAGDARKQEGVLYYYGKSMIENGYTNSLPEEVMQVLSKYGYFAGATGTSAASGGYFGYTGSSGTFDNPVNDKIAFSLGQKKADAIVNRSEEDLAYFYTAGMVERIKDKVSMAGKPDTVNMSSPVHNITNNSSQKSTVISPVININGNQTQTTPELKRAAVNITETALKYAGFKGLIT